METVFHDLKFAFRSLTKNPVFAGVIVLTLALGIGANTIIYSVVDGVVLNPFPFPDADRLITARPRSAMGYRQRCAVLDELFDHAAAIVDCDRAVDPPPVPDKVSRANTFAPMVSAGQVYVRPEHVAFKRQAGVFTASYLKAGGACDVLDAGMGALTEAASAATWSWDGGLLESSVIRAPGKDDDLDDELGVGWDDWRWEGSLDGPD